MCRTAFVDVLEHPALFTVQFAAHESGSDGVPARNLRAFRMAEASVAGLQLGQEVLYLFFKFLIAAASQDLISSACGQFLPIRAIHPRIEMLSRDKPTNTRVNLLSSMIVEAHCTLKGIGEPPSPTKTKAPQ